MWRNHAVKEVKDFVAEYWQIIVDECHHISAFTFGQVMRQVKAKYVVGLTATPTCQDGHHAIRAPRDSPDHEFSAAGYLCARRDTLFLAQNTQSSHLEHYVTHS
jgi:hypothetical protein